MPNTYCYQTKIKFRAGLKIIKVNTEQKFELCPRKCYDGAVLIYTKEK